MEVAAALGLGLSDLVPDVPIQIASTGVTFVYVALKNPAAVDRAVSSGEALTSALETWSATGFSVCSGWRRSSL